MRQFSLLVILSVFSVLSVLAQNGVPFNGLICDVDGVGLKAQIAVKGSDKRTVSNKEGKFGLTDVKSDDILEIKYKKSRIQVAVESRNSLKITLLDNGKIGSATADAALEAAGSDYVTRRELPVKGGVLTAEMIAREGFTNLADALRAKAANLTIDSSGNVTIRGVNSVGNHAFALIVCDGMELSSLNAVNINDVQSVEIQRDGTLYGFRGIGGVIVIKTKAGANRTKR